MNGATRIWPRVTFWKLVFLAVVLAGSYATAVRFLRGLGASTALSDQFPWGLWIGFDVLCGVGLAAGGFAITATVYLFHLERFRPIVRPTVLTAYLGYLLVCTALLYDLGRPYRIWHAIIMWNPQSVMFEVAWCVMLYSAVLTAEFLPVVLERIGWTRPAGLIKKFSVPLVLLGVILSTLHQSSLGSLFLIMPAKLHPLWYSPLLPALFFLSSIGAGLGMVIFESFLSWRAFRKRLESDLLDDIARTAAVVLACYLVLRFEAIAARGALRHLIMPQAETYYFWMEVALGGLAPMLLFGIPRTRRNPQGMFLAAVLAVLGFVTNRMNVSITGLAASSGVNYFPKWTEITVTLMLVAMGFAAFALAVRFLPIYGPVTHASPHAAPPERQRRLHAEQIAAGD
jgi:Ni/Fe-hydrogenase subunit HybB-like protein